MGLISSSGSFTRYAIVGEVSQERLREIPERLVKHAFQEIDHTADERSFGWVCFDDWLDMEWATAPPEKAHFMAFSLRLDTRRIPPAVYKKHVDLALRAEKEAAREAGKTFVGKDRKKEIREQVRLKLLARSMPIPAVFEAAWDVMKHEIYFNSTNSKTQELFEDLFTLTFELHLEPMTPYYLGLRLLDPSRHALLDELQPCEFGR